MRVVVFGATGGTGRQVCYQALEQGLEVVAFVRDPSRLGVTGPQLHVVVGDVLAPTTIPPALDGADAVVVGLGPRAGAVPNVCAVGTANIVGAMTQLGVRRLVVVTSLGVGDSRDQVPLAFRTCMATQLAEAIRDKELQEDIVRSSDLDWIVVRPGGLWDGPRTSDYRHGLDKDLHAGMVSRADVADFVLRQLVDDTYVGRTPAVVGRSQ